MNTALYASIVKQMPAEMAKAIRDSVHHRALAISEHIHTEYWEAELQHIECDTARANAVAKSRNESQEHMDMLIYIDALVIESRRDLYQNYMTQHKLIEYMKSLGLEKLKMNSKVQQLRKKNKEKASNCR